MDLLLAVAVDGASRLIRQGSFTEPASSLQTLEDWVLSADPIRGWAEASFLKDIKDVKARTSSRDAFTDFQSWAVLETGRPTQIGPNTFSERLKGLGDIYGFEYKREANWRGFLGMQLDPRRRAPIDYGKIGKELDVERARR